MEYKIKDAAEKTGLSSYTLRYYEKEGILPPIKRDDKGRRLYTEENIKWLDIIICLKKTGMPINDIKKIVELSIIGDITIDERKELLIRHRKKMQEQLKELQSNIEKVDKKIAYYNGAEEC